MARGKLAPVAVEPGSNVLKVLIIPFKGSLQGRTKTMPLLKGGARSSRLNPLDGSFINGQSFGNPNFGNCCSVYWDFDIEQTAPYVSANFDLDDLTVEASYRQTNNSVSGQFIGFGNAIIGPFDANGFHRCGLLIQKGSRLGDA